MIKKRKKIITLIIFISAFLIIFGLTTYQISKPKSPQENQLKIDKKIQNPSPPNNSPKNSSLSPKKEPQEKGEKNQPENNLKQNNSPQPTGNSVNSPKKEESNLSSILKKETKTPKPNESKLEESEAQKEEPKIPLSPTSQEKSKPFEIVKGKMQVPRRWLYTDEMDDILNSTFPPCEPPFFEEYHKEITQYGIYISPAGSFVWHKDIFQGKRDLNFYKTLKWNQEWEDPEIVFIPVNVKAFHHSLLVYKKSDNLFRHYDSLGECNFNFVKYNTTNNDNLISVSCPQQSGDSWGSCGTYPPVITSILLKRFKENKLSNPADWKISKEEFLAERDQIMDLI